MNGTVSDLSIVCMAVSCLFGFGLPIVLLLYFRKKFKADFMAFVVGGAVMFLFALVLEATVHQIILATPAGKAVLSSAILYAVYGGFMAALFEETGRFLAMKTILRPYQKKDVNALMYGAGHGGIEAAAILGIGMINNLIWSVMINTGNQGALTSSATGDVLASIQNVITALNPEEYAAGEGELFYLNSLHYDIYTPEQIQKFQRIMDAGVLTFSETPSEYGLDYTAIMPLKNSRGEVFALMCLDKPVEQIRDVLMRDTIIHLLLVAVLGLVVTVIFMFWIRSNVTKPILLLEKSVVEFANVSHDQSDPSKLVYEEPPIDTDNEVEMLSHAVTKMASDLRDYAQNLVDTQGQMVSMQTLVDEMNRLAHHDALTQVKNSTAYAATEQQLNQQIREGAARFALVMTDLNRLKQVNDTYGHEYGDDYLVGFAQLLTDSFPTSTVYRIGGDEFVVVLEGEDYERREDLCNDLRMQIRELTEDESRQPWARISAAVGLATYKESDRSVDDVFKRADVRMYEEKRHQGAGR